MAANKKFCMSFYMAFRYIEKDDMDFYPEMHHSNIVPIPDDQRILIHTSDDIDREIGKQMEQFKDKKKGILLSGAWILQLLLHIFVALMHTLSGS